MVDRYMQMPYTVEVVYTNEAIYPYKSLVAELPDCWSYGTTAVEAVEGAYEEMRRWIELELEEGNEPPPPHRMGWSG